jgi:tetratricopeptide (TPR) repeat protein
MPGREDVFQKAMSEGHSAAWDQQWDKAAAAYQKALKESPNHPKALASLGLALFQLQRFEESLDTYQQAAQASPEDPVLLEKVALLSERLGNLKQAIKAAMQAAELYIKNQEVEKAIENWLRVTQLDPDEVSAHARLAMVHERLGHVPQAVTEYLATAGLLQRAGSVDKAAEMVGRALRLKPDSQEARQATALLKGGQLLPKQMRTKGGTGPLRMAQVKGMESPKPTETGLDPVMDARQKALTRLAEVLFELFDEGGDTSSGTRGLKAIVRGTGSLSNPKDVRTKIMLHLGQAIDAQSTGQEAQAAEELERALEAGFKDPAIYFNLGMLRALSDRLESGLRNLQQAVKHSDYAMGGRLLMAGVLRKMGRLPEAATEYMQALRLADSAVVPPEQADEIRQLYEPLIEGQSRQSDQAGLEKLCDNIKGLLLRPDWQAQVAQAREQLPQATDGAPPMPLAEVLTQAQSSQVIEAIGRVHQMARAGHLRLAMDEAFYSIRYAPTFLPLHTLIGDLLIQDGLVQDAIAKYTVVAQSYSLRGEAVQATNLLRRIIQVAPMDLAVRTRLIDQLVARGQVDEALGEYIDLADMYYRLAELDMARKTYTTALQLAQQSNDNREWSLKILQWMGDIDMQHLDWKQAMRVYEQIRTLQPDDMSVRKNLFDLNIRLGEPAQASVELENFISYLETSGHRTDAIPLLEELVTENPKLAAVRRYLAEEFRHAGRMTDAVAQLDALGEILFDAGDRPGAIQIIESIVAMNPPNLKDYNMLLNKLESES